MSPFEHLAQAHARVDSRDLCFVGGQGKSGTTWVQLLLDAHPQVSALGEGLLAESLAAPLYALGERYAAAIGANNARFPELEDFPPLQAADLDALAQTALVLVLDRLARRKPQARVLAERSPENIGRIAEFHALFPHARFVHVLRDPRDVAVSLWHHGERLDFGSMPRRHGDPAGLARTLLPQWARLVVAARSSAASCGAELMELRYEDLHAQPNSASARLFGFLGVNADERTVASAVAACDFLAVSGRRRGEVDAGSHFRAGVAGAWREALAGWRPSWIDATTRSVFETLDYPLA